MKSAPPQTKVVCTVTCADVTLKLTLTPKFLSRPLVDALVNPFLGAYNKRQPPGMPPLEAGDVRVQVDGSPVADISSLDRPRFSPPWRNRLPPPGTPP